MTAILLKPSWFGADVTKHVAPPGQTITEILRGIPDLPIQIWSHGVVRIVNRLTGEAWEISREVWSRVRPREGDYTVNICLRLGDSRGGKNPLVTIAAIALIVATTAITGGILGPAGALSISTTFFAAGSTSAALLAGAVSLAGALLLNALSPPPSAIGAVQDQSVASNLGSASIQGNVLEPYEPVPFVMGTIRCAPRLAARPFSESVNDDQYVYAIYVLDGPHVVEDIRINDTPIDDLEDVEYEVRDVVNDNTPLTLINRQAYEASVGAELAEHKIKDDLTSQLQDEFFPQDSYPTWSSGRSRKAPDEIWLTFGWSAMVNQEADGTTGAAGVPVRIRVRRVGDTAWTNLPEMHAQRERLDAFRGTVKLRFARTPTSFVRLDQDTTRPPWGYALYVTNTQDDEGFDVDSYFAPPSGTNAAAVTGEDGVAVIYLDPAVFPPGTYDVQVKRGYAYRRGDFSPSSYKLSTNTPYFFSHTPASSPPSIRQDQARIAAKMTWSTITSVRNQPPIGETDLTLLALKVKNLAVSNVTFLATGYAYTPDTAGWNVFEPTSNPAAWFRHVALGAHSNRQPYEPEQMDDAGLEEWFGVNALRGDECNAYFEGKQSIYDALRIIAGTGRAAARFGDKVGVVIEQDRSEEEPWELFTQRNTRGLSIRRAFPIVPDGFRVTFNDEENDYRPPEDGLYVMRRRPSGNAVIEAITYVGITSRAKAVERANLDLSQILRRSTLYTFDCDIEGQALQKGTLVALAHDTIARHNDASRVISVATSGSNVTGITVEQPLRLSLIGEFGATESAGVVIQLKNNTTITAEVNETADTATLTFAIPFPIPANDDLEEGCLVASGPFSSVMKRMLVQEITYQGDMTASVTLVDEAPPVVLRFADGQLAEFGAEQAYAPF